MCAPFLLHAALCLCLLLSLFPINGRTLPPKLLNTLFTVHDTCDNAKHNGDVSRHLGDFNRRVRHFIRKTGPGLARGKTSAQHSRAMTAIHYSFGLHTYKHYGTMNG